MAGKDTRQKSVARTECNIQDPVLIVGSFELDGDDTDPTNVRGEGFLVTHSGDNDYLITLSEKYPGLISCTFGVQASAAGNADADDVRVVAEPYDAATGTLVLRVAVADTKSDLEDGQRVNFCLVFHKYTALNKTYT